DSAFRLEHGVDATKDVDEAEHVLLGCRFEAELLVDALRAAEDAGAVVGPRPNAVRDRAGCLAIFDLAAGAVLAVGVAAVPGAGTVVAQSPVGRGGDDGVDAFLWQLAENVSCFADVDGEVDVGEERGHLRIIP